jgi:hypothetical protein
MKILEFGSKLNSLHTITYSIRAPQIKLKSIKQIHSAKPCIMLHIYTSLQNQYDFVLHYADTIPCNTTRK